VIGYHRVKSDELEQVLAEGIKQTTGGKTDDDPDIVRADEFLDTLCPEKLRDTGISRKHNIYLYYDADGFALDVFDGQMRQPQDIVKNKDDVILAVELQAERCFISNLDLYDQVKTALKSEPIDKTELLARQYWDQVYPLVEGYKPLANERVEIMVTYDVSPDVIRVFEAP
jgi:hypothetical protein